MPSNIPLDNFILIILLLLLVIVRLIIKILDTRKTERIARFIPMWSDNSIKRSNKLDTKLHQLVRSKGFDSHLESYILSSLDQSTEDGLDKILNLFTLLPQDEQYHMSIIARKNLY